MAEALVLRGVSPNTLNHVEIVSSKDGEQKKGSLKSKTRSYYKTLDKECTGKDSEAGLERKNAKMPVLTPMQNLTPKPGVAASVNVVTSKQVSSAVRDSQNRDLPKGKSPLPFFKQASEPDGDTLSTILAAIQTMQTKQDEQDAKMKQMQFYDWSQDGGEAPIIELGLDQLRDSTGEPMDFSEHNFDQVIQDDDQLDLVLDSEMPCGQVPNSPFTGLSQLSHSSKRESIQPKTSSSLFDMAKKYHKIEEVSHSMNEGLAELINSIFREGLSEDSLGTLLKLKRQQGQNKKKCPALCTPRVNDLMWRILSPPAQSRDKLFQNLQTLMIKGSTMLARLVEKFDESNQEQFVESGLDALAVFGHASRQLINRRRDSASV